MNVVTFHPHACRKHLRNCKPVFLLKQDAINEVIALYPRRSGFRVRTSQRMPQRTLGQSTRPNEQHVTLAIIE